MQHGACYGIRKARQNTVLSSLVGVGAWRAQIHWVNQAWRVSCQFMYPNLLSSGSITTWRVAERFYAKDFGFLFDNTSLCCLCVCILLPYSFSFHITAVLYCIWLRVVYLFICSLLLYPSLSLSQSKIYQAVIFNLESKQLLGFHTFQNIQV